MRVLTQPGLADCWSVNVSVTGIGLIANPRAPTDGPREGAAVELEFSLPGAGGRIRVQGRVRWRHDAPGLLEGATASLGIVFERFVGSDQVRLARYLADYQLTVALAFGSKPEEALLQAELESDAQVLVARTSDELDELVSRGDVAAVVLSGEDGTDALAWVDSLSRRTSASAGSAAPDALAPRILFGAAAEPSRLLELFNRGRVFRALPRPLEPTSLRAIVLQACREHGMRIEQQRMALELERQLLRERAEAAPEARGGEGQGPGFGSPGMREVMELVRVAAPHRVAILLQGETGTGKEVLARTIHGLSDRALAPFVVQDCGALTETLLDSELFGHVKGSFTGAVADHPGLFVLADRGTIFLDEIENTTPNFQAKLLRVIETGEVRPVGGTQVRRVDVRVVAAANRDLSDEVRERRFRSDLFFRLNTFTVNVPPLRSRSEDVLALAYHFISLFNQQLGRTVTGLNEDAQDALLRARWPGNVRELRNAIERAVLLSRPGEPIGRQQLPPSVLQAADPRDRRQGPLSLKDQLDELERRLIREALARNGGVLRRAAGELRTDPVTLGRRAKRHGL